MAQPQTIVVEVLVPGLAPLQRVFARPDGPGPVSCDFVKLELKEEFGAGRLCRADSDVALAPAGELQPGSYVYRAFSGAGG